jgi:Kef-type K+ transport system membrane component KefB
VSSAEAPRGVRTGRLVVGLAILIAVLAAAGVVSALAARGTEPAPAIAGQYRADDGACFGDRFTLEQSGQFVALEGEGASGELRLRDGRLTGTASCADGSRARVDLALDRSGERISLAGTVAGGRFAALLSEPAPEPGTREVAAEERSGGPEEVFGRLMLAIATVILVARLVGALVGRLGQPHVMGEVLAGILLGPTLLGAIAPEVQDYLFPADVVPLLSAAAQIGLVFYLFLVGMELDPQLVRARLKESVLVSNAGVAFPMALGLLAAVPLYRLLAPDARYAPFALFVGLSMSVTAFPVLARILTERRMLQRPVGSLVLASAAIDDVTAWTLLALATAVAAGTSSLHALRVVALVGLFTLAMITVGRRILRRLSAAYDEVGSVPPLWIGIIFMGVLLSSYVAQQIGVAAIFGAFVMGAIMPRNAGLTDDVRRRLEDFIVTVLLPLFFVVTGLRTEIGSIDRPELWLVTALLIVTAIGGKLVGTFAAARYSRLRLRESAAIGVLMNTRGLAELIVLNVGLDLGLISPVLFTMLVIMAIVTTLMTGPALRLVDPRGTLSAPPEEHLRARTGAPGADAAERSILVAPQDAANMDSLLTLAEPLARSRPPRELVLVRLLSPARLSAGVSADDRELRAATEELNRRRSELVEDGVDVRVAAFTSPDPGADVVRLAAEGPFDLVLIDGRRPLLGGGVPRGDVGTVLREAPCDVAVLVEREAPPVLGADHPIVVPFGGADHDLAAVELAAWIASVRGAPLRLLGASYRVGDEARDASRLLADTSLVIQQLTGVAAEPVLVEPGPEVLDAAAGAGLLVVGLSERWRSEGLGALREEIVRAAPAPTLLVRRGTRPGALAPRENVTRYRWSAVELPARR